MKKFITSILAAALLLSLFAVNVFAADDSVKLSIKGAEGKPGDIVEVQVFMDENPGLWACAFNVVYNPAYFQLGNVENGTVFSESAFIKSAIAPTGRYWFYAQYSGLEEKTSETGLLLTLYFKILDTAPNGAHNVSLDLDRGGDGWFIKVGPDHEAMDLTIDAGSPSQIRVTDSTATAPETETAATDTKDTTDAAEETTGRPKTEYVTDEDGYVVRDEDGTPVTQVVTQAVTNDDGTPVYDEDGNPVTEIVTEKVPETQESDVEKNEGDKTPTNTGMKKIILIVGIILLVVAAAIIMIILFNARKKGNGPKDETDASDTDNHSDTEE